MAGYTTRSGEARYRCTTHTNYARGACSANSIKESFLHERLFAYIERDVLNPDGLAELHERRRLEHERLKKEQPARLEALRRQAAGLTEKIEGLTAKLAALAEIDPDGLRHYHDTIRQWRAQREKVEAQVAEALHPPALAELDVAVEHLRDYLGRLRDVLENGDPRRTRLLLGELVDRIELSFTARTLKKQTRSTFERGIFYVRPQASYVSSKTQGRL
jgi:hypothetical protein